jgi:hypothetical protein
MTNAPEFCFLWINHWSTCMTKDQWPQTFAAIATAAAVVVSLYLAQRHPRPRLAAFVPAAPGIEPGGIGVNFKLVNDSGIATTLTSIRPFILRQWCPRILVPLLGRVGIVPTVEVDPHVTLGRAPQRIDARGERMLTVTLWEEHRAKLRAGRMLLRVVHTHSQPRANWIFLEIGSR